MTQGARLAAEWILFGVLMPLTLGLLVVVLSGRGATGTGRGLLVAGLAMALVNRLVKGKAKRHWGVTLKSGLRLGSAAPTRAQKHYLLLTSGTETIGALNFALGLALLAG